MALETEAGLGRWLAQLGWSRAACVWKRRWALLQGACWGQEPLPWEQGQPWTGELSTRHGLLDGRLWGILLPICTPSCGAGSVRCPDCEAQQALLRLKPLLLTSLGSVVSTSILGSPGWDTLSTVSSQLEDRTGDHWGPYVGMEDAALGLRPI